MKETNHFFYNHGKYTKTSPLQAFTLVELIVVVTILALLSTIGFVSYSSYLSGVRDTNRLSQLVAISDGLELYRTKKTLPIPDDNIEIRANGTTIGYQGYAGTNVLETIDYSKTGKDPKDKIHFSYYLTQDKKHYQLLTYLEEEENLETKLNLINKVKADTDYTNRYPKVSGKKLGILTQSGTNIPVQEVTAIVSSGYLDIGTTTENYIARLTDDNTISGTGIELIGSLPNASCRRIQQMGGSDGDGEYKISTNGNLLEVYCNFEFPDANFYTYVEDGDMESASSTNWDISKKSTGESYSGNYSLKYTGNASIKSNNYTYIQPGQRYKLEGYFKSVGSELSRIYYGFAEYDENFDIISNSHVNAKPGTDTILSSDVNSTDTSIEFDCDDTIFNNWQTYLVRHGMVAFQVDSSGNYDDLPNRKLSQTISSSSYSSVAHLVTKSGNTCTFAYHPSVGKKAGVTYPAGTKIRLHSSGGTYNYRAASNASVPSSWTKFSGEVAGISKYGTNNNYFRRGTKFIKIMVLPNYAQSSNAVIHMDDLELVEY